MVTTDLNNEIRILPIQKEEYSSIKANKAFGYSRYTNEALADTHEEREERRASNSSNNSRSERHNQQRYYDDNDDDDNDSFASAPEGKIIVDKDNSNRLKLVKKSSNNSSYDAQEEAETGVSNNRQKVEAGKHGDASGAKNNDSEQDEDEDDILGYKRMNLKGESESDKDLIIYSLNESLQIYKETVERIQGEKDDLEFQYEQNKKEEEKMIEEEKAEVAQLKTSSDERLNKLESLYQTLLKELEAKKLDYQRMQSRFHSHKNKGTRQSMDDDTNDIDGGKPVSIQDQIQTLLRQIEDICQPLAGGDSKGDKGSKSKNNDSASVYANSELKDYFNQLWPEMMEKYFKQQPSISSSKPNSGKKKKKNKKKGESANEQQEDGLYLESRMIPLLAQKLLMQLLLERVFLTSIHPGVSMNTAFGKIHKWVDKRNYTWAARLRQQITQFIVKQSTEEKDAIDKAIESILELGYEQLCALYSMTSTKSVDADNDKLSKKDRDRLKRKWSEIVRRALKLDLAIKGQDDPVILLNPVDEGAIYDENTMKVVNAKDDLEAESEDHNDNNNEEMTTIAFMITPIFMTSPYCEDPEKTFVVPAKVYCDTLPSS